MLLAGCDVCRSACTQAVGRPTSKLMQDSIRHIATPPLDRKLDNLSALPSPSMRIDWDCPKNNKGYIVGHSTSPPEALCYRGTEQHPAPGFQAASTAARRRTTAEIIGHSDWSSETLARWLRRHYFPDPSLLRRFMVMKLPLPL